MIELVSLAEARLAGGRRKTIRAGKLPAAPAQAAQVAPILRGLLAIETDTSEGTFSRLVLAFRSDEAIRRYVDGAELGRYSQIGTVTPDHAIRTKSLPLLLPAPTAGDLDGFARQAAQAVDDYAAATRPISRATMRAWAASRPRSTPCRGCSWCPGSASSPPARAPRTQPSSPIWRRPRSR